MLECFESDEVETGDQVVLPGFFRIILTVTATANDPTEPIVIYDQGRSRKVKSRVVGNVHDNLGL